jgi:hypothetical protein
VFAENACAQKSTERETYKFQESNINLARISTERYEIAAEPQDVENKSHSALKQ